MKYVITLLILLMSCKNEVKNVEFVDSKPLINTNFYEIIFSELSKINIEQLYISYEVSNDFEISKDIEHSLLKTKVITEVEKNKLSNQFVINSFSTKLSLKTEELIMLSNRNKAEKIELHYLFSKPYQVAKDKVIIFNTIKYRHHFSKIVKGGTERIIVFNMKNDGWEIVKIKNLIDI